MISNISEDINEEKYYNAELEMSRNNETSILNAKQLYNEIITSDKNNLGANIGLSKCLIKESKYEEAECLLDIILQEKPFHETYPFFEEAYLMRAHIMMIRLDFRTAQHFISLALKLNLSSRKAWEMCAEAHIACKLYNEAVHAYLHCWELGAKQDLEIGFKLAKCALLANRPDEAISISREIMDINPLFNNIKETILIPAFRALKPS